MVRELPPIECCFISWTSSCIEESKINSHYLSCAETAITLCKENNIPVLVLNMLERGTIMRAVLGESVGTVVCENCDNTFTDEEAAWLP